MLQPAFQKNNIPIVFSSDDNYAPYLGVCIKSLIENSSLDNNYDICIIDGGITPYYKELLSGTQCANISIRFIDITPYLQGYDLSIFQLTLHFTIATYYRFFLPKIFSQYAKLIYLDCDMLVLRDVAELNSINIGDCCLGVTRDIEIIRMCTRHPERKDYFYETLKMSIHENYFQAGCMLCNIAKMQEDNFTEKAIDELKRIKSPLYVDQCVMNALLDGNVHFIPQNWNFTWHLPFVDNNYAQYLPSNFTEQYLDAERSPYIIHFTGMTYKPWIKPHLPKAHLFWQYAKMTPFYEIIMYRYNNNEFYKLYQKFNYRRYYLKYVRYKILSKITFGKMRAYYKNKKLDYKILINEIRYGGEW